jgi:hypothetical protein
VGAAVGAAVGGGGAFVLVPRSRHAAFSKSPSAS